MSDIDPAVLRETVTRSYAHTTGSTGAGEPE